MTMMIIIPIMMRLENPLDHHVPVWCGLKSSPLSVPSLRTSIGNPAFKVPSSSIAITTQHHHHHHQPSPSSWSSISTITITIIIVIIILILPDRDSSLPRRLPSWPARSPSTRRNGYDDEDDDDDDDYEADVAGVQVRCQPAPKSWTACYLERSSNFYHWHWFQGAEIIFLFIVFINHTTTIIIIISTMIIL